jgi:aminopeptidase-like protein
MTHPVNIAALRDTVDLSRLGREMHDLVAEMYPICRSITGDGFRQTLKLISKRVPLAVHEVPTGTKVFDWTVPKEWNIRDAYVKNVKGERIIDFRQSSLHVLNYSSPVKAKVSRDELKKHLYTIPEHPDWIPYRTSYYQERWGFCVTHKQSLELTGDEYDVCIHSSLQDGHLTYGEYLVKGQSPDEVLISCHSCHPSLANDNLSGMALATFLARLLNALPLRYSYRFVFIPGTIGSITWLSRNEETAQRIKHGLVITCVGDAGHLTYKKSRRGNAEIDRAAAHVLKHTGQQHEILEFTPYGYDERQYCSPGFNLPVGCLMRTPNGCYPEYHTSADNLDFVKPQSLADSLAKCLSILFVLEHNRKYVNQNPNCEPQLGRRGLYQTIGGRPDAKESELALLWVLNLSDGQRSLLDIAERSGLEFGVVKNAADDLLVHSLLKECPETW